MNTPMELHARKHQILLYARRFAFKKASAGKRTEWEDFEVLKKQLEEIGLPPDDYMSAVHELVLELDL